MTFGDVQERPDYLAPAIASDGTWGSLGGIAFRDALAQGSYSGAIDLLNSMDDAALLGALGEAGVHIAPDTIARGKQAILESVRSSLEEAGREKIPLAAKDEGQRGDSRALPMDLQGRNATGAIQDVFRSREIAVELLGDARHGARASLTLVAGQALLHDRQGFAFEGIAGKYQVPLSMAEVVELHRDAAQAVAEESTRAALGAWVAGNKVTDLSEWVPDAVQRLLQGSVSMATASAVVSAIDRGSIGRHAGDIGAHLFSRSLADQGFDVNAATVEQQAADLTLTIVEPDRNRGQYVGKVIGLDHRASLIRFNRTSAVELPFDALAEGQRRPEMGDMVRMGFKAGALSVSYGDRLVRDGSER